MMQCVVGMNNAFCPLAAADSELSLTLPTADAGPVTVDAMATDDGITLNASGPVGAGEFEGRYDSSLASFVGCDAMVEGAAAICHKAGEGVVRISYIDPQGSAAGPLVTLRFTADAGDFALSTTALADALGNQLLDDAASQSEQIFLPFLIQ